MTIVDTPFPTSSKRASYWEGVMTVVDIVQETDDIFTFRLSYGGSQVPFSFKAGQYVDLSVEISGAVHHRSYSISSSDRQHRCIDLTIKQERQGMVSSWLCDKVRSV